MRAGGQEGRQADRARTSVSQFHCRDQKYIQFIQFACNFSRSTKRNHVFHILFDLVLEIVLIIFINSCLCIALSLREPVNQ